MCRQALTLLISSFCLSMYGLIILYSATQPFTNGINLFKKQCVWLCISFLGFLFFSSINLKKLKKYSVHIGVISFITLIIVLIPGIGVFVNGTRRWLNCCGIRIQPSEQAKLCFVIFFSYYLCEIVKNSKNFYLCFLKPVIMIGIFILIIMLEPDFGTAFLFGCVGLFMLLLNGARLKFIIPCFIIGITLFLLAVYFNPIRLRRITAFLDVEGNRLNSAYQLWQSLIAFGSGGFTGVGLGQGRQQHFFLPEAHTDFIFSVLGEELGILHVLIVIALFAIIAYTGLRIIKNNCDPFLIFVGIGTLSFLIFQVFLNIGVVTGLLPTKGLSLPFLSYGGSNLLTSFCFIGLLVNLCKDSYVLPNRETT